MVESNIKYMDIREFREKGFLQEVNRKFFHPLGLALEIIVEEDGSTRLGGVWDYRDDPEGNFFNTDIIKQDKIDYVEELRKSKLMARSIQSGFKTNGNGIQII